MKKIVLSVYSLKSHFIVRKEKWRCSSGVPPRLNTCGIGPDSLVSEHSPKMGSGEGTSECFREYPKKTRQESHGFNFFKNTKLFLGYVFQLLPGVADRSELPSAVVLLGPLWKTMFYAPMWLVLVTYTLLTWFYLTRRINWLNAVLKVLHEAFGHLAFLVPLPQV